MLSGDCKYARLIVLKAGTYCLVGPILGQRLTSAIFQWCAYCGKTSTYPGALICLHMQRKTPSAIAKKPKKIDTFLLINGSCACYFKRIITATAKTMMPVLGMVNQPLAAAMTWAAVTHVLNDNNRRGWKTTLKATGNNDQWTWRVIAVHFTTPTHHHLLERRCLDINSPRSDPECMWLLCPGYR